VFLCAGPNYEVWITRGCEDVTSQVLPVVEGEADPLKRANAVRDCTQAIAAKAEAAAKEKDPSSGVRCDVQEMFPNESYVLFTQERLLDVRIVYVPPKALGNFGGDTDNFEWPRHTADFTLLRAYVAPDGSAAAFDAANVPYKPKKCLRISPAGAEEGDFVFLLGFPGHTMRYAPTSRLQVRLCCVIIQSKIMLCYYTITDYVVLLYQPRVTQSHSIFNSNKQYYYTIIDYVVLLYDHRLCCVILRL
jgi:hypothetical protein